MNDINLVNKIETYKSGYFSFSLKYDKEKLDRLLFEANLLFNAVRDIPILPQAASRLEEDLIKRSIFGTAAIEGSPLSEEKVREVLSEDEKKQEGDLARKEILGLKHVYKEIKEVKPGQASLEITEEQIKLFHKLITTDCNYKNNVPGQYRNHRVEVGDQRHGGIYVPPKILEDIKNLMGYLTSWLNSPQVLAEDPTIRAALAHYYLALIHPFGDGNGRTARAVEALLLRGAGIKYVAHMLSNFYYNNIDDYFWAFSLSARNKECDITPFLEFYSKGVITSLKEIKTRISAMIKVLAIRDYLSFSRRNRGISQRQYNLLILLLEFKEKISLKDLFEKDKFKVIYGKVSERTARRDLEHLSKKLFIVPDKNGAYQFNYEILA